MPRYIIVLLIFLGALIKLSPLYASETLAKPVSVVTSFSILRDMVEQIGGVHVDVYSLVKEDEDPHVFRARPNDAARLRNAEIVFVNGLGFEGWMDRLVQAAGFKGKIVVASEGIDVIEGEDDHPWHPGHEFHASTYDPHAWHSLGAARTYIQNINQALSEIKPQFTDYFNERTSDYISRLDSLDQWLKTQLSGIPEERRAVVVPHDSFAYLARDYGISFHSLRGVSTEADATPQDVAAIVRLIREKNIKALYIENVSDARLIQQVQRETGATIMGTLISGALSEGVADSYEAMMRYNFELLLAAFTP